MSLSRTLLAQEYPGRGKNTYKIPELRVLRNKYMVPVWWEQSEQGELWKEIKSQHILETNHAID